MGPMAAEAHTGINIIHCKTHYVQCTTLRKHVDIHSRKFNTKVYKLPHAQPEIRNQLVTQYVQRPTVQRSKVSVQ